MNDTISRQAAIKWVKTECNPYGKPTLDFESGKKVIEHLERMPSAQPDNQINLCNSCDYSYPDCPSKNDDVIFGNDIGNDNICACNKYKPSAQPERKTGKWIVYYECPKCGEITKDFMEYCPFCGADMRKGDKVC